MKEKITVRIFALIILLICLNFTLFGFGRAAAISGDLFSVTFGAIVLLIVDVFIIDFILRRILPDESLNANHDTKKDKV